MIIYLILHDHPDWGVACGVGVGVGMLASSARHHQGDGPASPLGRVGHGHRAVCGGGLVVEVGAVVEVDSEPS